MVIGLAIAALLLALVVEAGVEIMPLPFGYEWELPYSSIPFIKVGLILMAIGAGLYVAMRLWKHP